MLNKKREMVNGWLFIPGSMVFAAFTWGVVQTIPGIMLKSMEVSNTLVGLAGLLGLPLSFRFLLGPFVDGRGTKRNWVLVSQRFITGAMLLVAAFCAGCIFFDWHTFQMQLLMTVFALMSFMSVFHDLAWGGFFLASVDERDKALFVGVNSAFVRLAIIFAQGFMVILAGKIEAQTGKVMAGWAVCFGVLGLIQLALMIYHHFIYPYPVLDKPVPVEEQQSFVKVFARFFELPRAGVILAFVFLYRIGQGLQNFMQVPFLMDSPENGGLGLSLEQVGIMNGVLTMLAMVTGGVAGGLLLKKYGLRKTIWPFAFLMTVPNLGYVWLAHHPDYSTVPFMGTEINLRAQTVMLIEALGYGMGFSSFAFLHCEVSRGPYRATFFALVTGVMNISWMLSGAISGILQEAIGYTWLFVLGIVVSIPGIVIIAWLPLKELERRGQEEDAARHTESVKGT
jgi:PAT family beta-lactamase induction signal transducer AmpG